MKVAIVADRIGWEERRLIDAAGARGLAAFWLDDGDLCAGPAAEGVPPADLYLVRSRGYTRSAVLAGLLGDRDERVVNTAAAIAICQDKLATARALHAAGVPVPPFRVVLTRRDLARALGELGLPCVLKPILGGLGRRVLLIRDRDLADAAYDYVEQFAGGFDRVLLAQPFLPGGDERAFVVGGRVVAAYRRVAGSDWRANLATGGAAERIDADAELTALATAAAGATGAEIFALDVLRDAAGRRFVNEINHVPQFRGGAEATGVDLAAAVLDHLAGHRTVA
ncbi:RimK family alpha-L-glutamate ligase [Dactylosporangium salmoneum]|uniref:Lysine biosynthesis protein LysX n=1 Tax=Dactylosporangium salmoneum TaxID=53361 RepID=A0ABN3FZ97_9ACTN